LVNLIMSNPLPHKWKAPPQNCKTPLLKILWQRFCKYG